MDSAKIRLSQEEEALVTRTDWILTKNQILIKIKLLLEQVQTQQQQLLQGSTHTLPPEITNPLPKISKGENYKGLPYLVLDHPRYFDKENIFAIRHLFWWGNFFSTTLHLSGIPATNYQQKVIASFTVLKEAGFYIAVSKEQWEHHFETNNYVSLATITAEEFQAIIINSSFIKLSKKISIDQWENAGQTWVDNFTFIIALLCA